MSVTIMMSIAKESFRVRVCKGENNSLPSPEHERHALGSTENPNQHDRQHKRRTRYQRIRMIRTLR